MKKKLHFVNWTMGMGWFEIFLGGVFSATNFPRWGTKPSQICSLNARGENWRHSFGSKLEMLLSHWCFHWWQAEVSNISNIQPGWENSRNSGNWGRWCFLSIGQLPTDGRGGLRSAHPLHHPPSTPPTNTFLGLLLDTHYHIISYTPSPPPPSTSFHLITITTWCPPNTYYHISITPYYYITITPSPPPTFHPPN